MRHYRRSAGLASPSSEGERLKPTSGSSVSRVSGGRRLTPEIAQSVFSRSQPILESHCLMGVVKGAGGEVHDADRIEFVSRARDVAEQRVEAGCRETAHRSESVGREGRQVSPVASNCAMSRANAALSRKHGRFTDRTPQC